MKKLFLNSGLVLSLVLGLISLWVVANPQPARAEEGGAEANCQYGEKLKVTCSAVGATCYGHDPDNNTDGYCFCMRDGVMVDYDECWFYYFQD
jgi:hypothetical protein